MSRIRSIHPGIFTDEAFMSASLAARMLVMGIWGQAWDDGVFEWKPLTLKARIFPVDSVDMTELLTELEGLSFICRFSANDRPYGAIRNFRKWQKPKMPNASGVLPEELRKYVGLKSEDFSNPSPKPPLMEDGGREREEEEEANDQQQPPYDPAAAAAAALNGFPSEDQIEAKCREATGWQGTTGISAIADLMQEGFDLEGRILPLLREQAALNRERKQPPPKRWAYMAKAIRDVSRRVAPAEKRVEQVIVRPLSADWNALVKSGKPESFMRSMSEKHGGFPVLVSELEQVRFAAGRAA